jgi:hypothetical protein
MLLHAIEMQHQGAKSGVIWVGKLVDDRVDGVTAHDVVVVAGGVDECRVGAQCQQRVGQFAEELFEEACYTVDVVMEGCWVAKVDER